MKKITVISGKGGTGKTTLVSNLAALAEKIIIADCDVDAPNLHLLLQPQIIKEDIFRSSKLAVKEEARCTECGMCQGVCRFKAIAKDLRINPIKCDGCGVCVAVCPQKALSLKIQDTGHIFISKTKYGPMVHARLKAGAENSGKLVSKVRDIADEVARKEKRGIIIIDGSPGIGCPVVASLKGVDYSLIVTEPTLSGLSDLKRVIKLTKLFKLKTYIIINKFDLNEDISLRIEQYCKINAIDLIGKISFSPLINQVLGEGKLLVDIIPDSKPAIEIKAIWQKILKLTGGDSNEINRNSN